MFYFHVMLVYIKNKIAVKSDDFTDRPGKRGVLMYTYQQVNTDEIQSLINEYYKSLSAPMDDMWEESVLPKSTYYLILREKPIGFFAMNDENIMTQFYIVDYEYSDAFVAVLNYFYIDQAMVSTYDPVFHSIASKFKKASVVKGLLFIEDDMVTLEEPMEGLTYEHAKSDDLEEVTRYHDNNFMGGDFLEDYLKRLIDAGGLLLVKYEGAIIGTGEYRVSKNTENVANVGMTVSEAYRKKGLGAYILSYIRELCLSKGYVTICGCDTDNIASRKAIEKVGYKSYHKVLNVWF